MGDSRETASPQVTSRIRRPGPWTLAFFLIIARLSFASRFTSLRVAHVDRLASIKDEEPLIIFLNHASWWDPLPVMLLQLKLLPRRVLFAPADAVALSHTRHLRLIGFFPVDTGTLSGTKQFLRDCSNILNQPDAVLSITPEGDFRDPRARPLDLRRGLAALLARSGRVTVLPLGLEYSFWDKPRPEMLASWGEPLHILDGRSKSTDEWHAVVTSALTAALDELATISMAREHWRFRNIVYGRLGRRNLAELFADLRSLFQNKRSRID